jgi:hypothetical protein
VRVVTQNFLPARVHVREQAADFKRFGERYGAPWTPTILLLDSGGVERHRIEGFLPVEDFVAQVTLGLGHLALQAGRWKDAERHFQAVVQDFAGTDAAPEALYWRGVARYKAGDAGALGETARLLQTSYRDSAWAKKASVWSSGRDL